MAWEAPEGCAADAMERAVEVVVEAVAVATQLLVQEVLLPQEEAAAYQNTALVV